MFCLYSWAIISTPIIDSLKITGILSFLDNWLSNEVHKGLVMTIEQYFIEYLFLGNYNKKKDNRD